MSLPPKKNEPQISLALKQPAKTSKTVYNRLVGSAFAIDMIVVLGALMLAYWVRFGTILVTMGTTPLATLTFSDYYGHFLVGAALMILILVNFRFYSRECLLSYPATLRVILKSSIVWLVTFLSITLVLEFDPSISRIFSAIGMLLLFAGLGVSRTLLWNLIRSPGFSSSLRQRALVVGWSDEFAMATRRFKAAPERHFDIVGIIAPPGGEFATPVPNNMPVMGRFKDLQLLLQMRTCQMVIVADNMFENENLLKVASTCEKEMIDFKLILTCFRSLQTGLHLETIGDIPVLGISKLPLDAPIKQYIKRAFDIAGGLAGLMLSLPIIAILGAIIYRESPGSVFYRQRRLGANGHDFDMIKLRSMKLDAEADGKVGWTVEDDPRRLQIGELMRKWNLDEVPQFWNVLVGDMSLVGPRPERPELIEQFKENIPHYNARHNIKPGITGWAQVNGLRGDTDLSERVRFDLHYIENWSVLFDIQIMLLTFFRRDGAC